MALIQCPECNQSISDKASKCPKCGYPIQEYFSRKTEENKGERENVFSDPFVIAENPESIQQTLPNKKSKKKWKVGAIIVACIAIAVLVGGMIGTQVISSNLSVESIIISKWRLTDSTEYWDYYEGTITSEQKKPFIAVIGRYDEEEQAPRLVYVEDGVGVLETTEDTDEDPSIKYRAIGYLGGTSVASSDITVTYSDSDYYDSSYSQWSSCSVLIDVDMNHSKTGFLVFDIVNETNNEKETNKVAVIIDGKTQYSYYAELPYKARGIDVSIVPKLFCESKVVTSEDYVIEKPYTAEKYEGTYSKSYSGEEVLSFNDFADGFVLYTRELKEGGEKENRNVVGYSQIFLHDGECTITTYDSVDEDENILMPKYEFNIIGYVTWTPLEKETK